MKILKVGFPSLQARRSMSKSNELEGFMRSGPIPECVCALIEFESASTRLQKAYFEHDGARFGWERKDPDPSVVKAIAEAKNDPDQIRTLRESLRRIERSFDKNRARQKASAFKNAAVKFFESGASQEEAAELVKEAFVQATHDS